MIIKDDVKNVVEGTAFLTLVTVGADGLPYPIVAGKGEVSGENIIFNIHKMEITQKNLAKNSAAWVIGATLEGAPCGYRLTGTAAPKDKHLVFTPAKIETLV